MGSVRTWVASAIALANVLSPSAFAKGSIQATQLSVVPLDASIACNRRFFKATDLHKGTVFFMPRVEPGNGKVNSEFRLYELARSGKAGKYVLTINLYFPMNDDAMMSHNATETRKDPNACNFDSVKLAINKGLEAGEEPIKRIAPAPLTSIEVAIKVISEIGLIGRKKDVVSETETEVDDLDYYGKVRTVSFEITDEEMRYFNASLVNDEGIPATVKFNFQVRALDGSVTATLNVEEIKKRLTAAANGAAYMVKADVKAALSSALDRRSISITSQAGSEEANKMMQEMVTKVMSEFSLAIDNAVAQDAAAGQPEAAEGKISVTAALELLSNQVERTLTWKGFSAPEKAIRESEIKLYSNALNNYVARKIKVEAGYRDENLGIELTPGRSIGILNNGWSLYSLKYVPKTKYMTTSQISYFEVGHQIPEITNKNMTVTNVDRNGTDVAIGKMAIFGGLMNSFAEYRWVLITQESVATRISSARPTTMAEDVKTMPVGVSFTGLNENKVNLLRDLLKPNKNWDAWIDEEERLIIRAKANLGDVVIRDVPGPEDVGYSPGMDTYRVYMVYEDALGQKTYPPVTVGYDGNPLTKQRVNNLTVLLPEAFESGYTINSKSINNEPANNGGGEFNGRSNSLPGVKPGPAIPSTDPQP